MIPATIPRIVLKPTANAAVCAVRSKRTVPLDRPASLTRTTTPAPRPSPTPRPRGARARAAPPPDAPGRGAEPGRDGPRRAADGPPDADLAGPLGHAHG